MQNNLNILNLLLLGGKSLLPMDPQPLSSKDSGKFMDLLAGLMGVENQLAIPGHKAELEDIPGLKELESLMQIFPEKADSELSPFVIPIKAEPAPEQKNPLEMQNMLQLPIMQSSEEVDGIDIGKSFDPLMKFGPEIIPGSEFEDNPPALKQIAEFDRQAFSLKGIVDQNDRNIDLKNLLGNGFLKLSDIENLKPGENLRIEIPGEGKSQNDVPAVIEFTRIDQNLTAKPNQFSAFEIAYETSRGTQKFPALLVGDNPKEAVSLKEFSGMIENTRGREARLIVFAPEQGGTAEKAIDKSMMIQSQNGETSRVGTLTDNAAGLMRRINLEREFSVRQEPAVKTDNVQANDSVVRMAGSENTENEFEQMLLKGEGRNLTNTRNISQPAPQPEVFADKLAELSGGAKSDQQISELRQASSADQSNNLKQETNYRQVEFKLEPPQGGTKIPEGGYFRIKLQPDELGKIDVQLKVVEDKLVAKMTVDTPQARQAVEANLNQLRETLHNHGIKVESVMIDMNSNHQNFNQNLAGQNASGQNHNQTRNLSDGFQDEEGEIVTPESSSSARATNLKGNLSLLA